MTGLVNVSRTMANCTGGTILASWGTYAAPIFITASTPTNIGIDRSTNSATVSPRLTPCSINRTAKRLAWRLSCS